MKLVTLGVLTGVVTASAIGSKKIYEYVNKLKRKSNKFEEESNHWQELYYDKVEKDDIAWG